MVDALFDDFMSSIDFEIRAFMKDVGYVLAIKSEMNYEITEAFNKEGIEIPFAQRDVNFKAQKLM